jgi:hypothetical protein
MIQIVYNYQLYDIMNRMHTGRLIVLYESSACTVGGRFLDFGVALLFAVSLSVFGGVCGRGFNSILVLFDLLGSSPSSLFLSSLLASATGITVVFLISGVIIITGVFIFCTGFVSTGGCVTLFVCPEL